MDHYKGEYFAWQKKIGEFGGTANLFKFEKHIAPNDCVIDFGSGGGFLLANLDCKKKIGVEINEVARNYAAKLGIKSVESSEMIEDNWADVIISNHALEHVENPLCSLKSLYSKLKTNGKIIFVVPHERKQLYREDDEHQHLFTWSAANLGNLFKRAGFTIIQVKDLKYTSPPKSRWFLKVLGKKHFYHSGKIYHSLRTAFSFLFKADLTQVIVVASK